MIRKIFNATADFGPGVAIATLGLILILAGIVPGALLQ